jgi:hypothetical protein
MVAIMNRRENEPGRMKIRRFSSPLYLVIDRTTWAENIFHWMITIMTRTMTPVCVLLLYVLLLLTRSCSQ